MTIRREGSPRYCNCTKTTPVSIRVKRYRCEAHKYLRSGEAVYMTPGRLVFVTPKRRDRNLNTFGGAIEDFLFRLDQRRLHIYGEHIHENRGVK